MFEHAPAASNRRLSRRRLPKSRVQATCRRGALDLGPNLAVAVLDVSETGVRLVLKEAVEPGCEVSVGLEGQSHPRPIVRVGSVVWRLSIAEGAYCVGIHFQKRLPYREFVELSRPTP